jgi:hypothetical protein
MSQNKPDVTQVTGQAGYIQQQQQQQQVPSHPVPPQQVPSQQVRVDFMLPSDHFLLPLSRN